MQGNLETTFEPTDSDKAIQRAEVLAHLRKHGSLGTLEAREVYRVQHPAGRIMELRRAGFEIATTRDPATKCAVYVLGEVAQ